MAGSVPTRSWWSRDRLALLNRGGRRDSREQGNGVTARPRCGSPTSPDRPAWPDPVQRGNVTANQPSAAVEATGHRWTADVVRPTPMLTPDGEPAIADWSLDDGVRHLNHGSFGAVPVIAQRAQAGFRQVMDENP